MTTVSRSRAMSTPSVLASVSPTRSTSSSRRWASRMPGRHDHVGQDQQHVGPGGQGQPAQNPAVYLLQRLVVLLLQPGLHRGEQRGYRHPGQHDGCGGAHRAGAAADPGARAQQIGDRDGERRAGERSGRQQLRAAARDDHDGGPETAARGHPEQVRIGQRVAEHALVSGAATGQHGADQGAEHDPGQPELPDDVGVDGRHPERRMPRQQLGEQRPDHDRQGQPGRADGHPGQQGGDQHGGGHRDRAPGTDPGQRGQRGRRTPAGRRGLARHRLHRRPSSAGQAAVSTVRSRSVTRGPQREAMSSFSAMTWPALTAASPDQPGRLATVAAS